MAIYEIVKLHTSIFNKGVTTFLTHFDSILCVSSYSTQAKYQLYPDR